MSGGSCGSGSVVISRLLRILMGVVWQRNHSESVYFFVSLSLSHQSTYIIFVAQRVTDMAFFAEDVHLLAR